METELQTLQREIDELRNENIALHNELVKQNKILFEQIISIGKELANQQNNLHQAIRFFGGANLHDDLKIHLTRLTAMQSAEFIIDKMPKVKAFDNRGDYLKTSSINQMYRRRAFIWSSASGKAKPSI